MSFTHLRARKEGEVAGVEDRNDRRNGQWQDHVEPLASKFPNWDFSKLGKEYIKAVYCHPAYLTSMQSTSCEIRAG